MPAQDLPVAHSADELTRLLRQQGLAAAAEASVSEGFDGEENAAVIFPNRSTTSVFGVGFSTKQVSMDAAHRVVSEIAPTLVRQPPQTVKRVTVTFYYERRR